jgi:hypothetical protein
MSSFSRGPETQSAARRRRPAGGVNICYEDVFGEEIIRSVAAGRHSRQPLQHCLVRAFAGPATALADRPHACRRNRPADAARYQYRHDRRDRPPMVRCRRYCTIHAGRTKGGSSSLSGHDARMPLIGNWGFLLLAGLLPARQQWRNAVNQRSGSPASAEGLFQPLLFGEHLGRIAPIRIVDCCPPNCCRPLLPGRRYDGSILSGHGPDLDIGHRIEEGGLISLFLATCRDGNGEPPASALAPNTLCENGLKPDSTPMTAMISSGSKP